MITNSPLPFFCWYTGSSLIFVQLNFGIEYFTNILIPFAARHLFCNRIHLQQKQNYKEPTNLEEKIHNGRHYFLSSSFDRLVLDLGFTMLLTSQVISIAFYSEHEKSYKFYSEALILAWGFFFACCKSSTQDPQLYFPSEGSHTQDFYTLKKSIHSGKVWTCEPRIQWRHALVFSWAVNESDLSRF